MENFDLNLRPRKTRIPTRQDCISAFFSLLDENSQSFIPSLFYINLFFRVFETPLERRDLKFYFDKGKPALAVEYDDWFSQKITPEFFQSLYDRAVAVVRHEDNNYILFYREGVIILATLRDEFMRIGLVMTNESPKDIMWIFEDAKPHEEIVDKTKFNIAIRCEHIGIGLIEETIKQKEISIAGNYCDDIPYDRIKEILEKEGESLVLFYGEPGTGKSSLIRKLITDVNRKFIIMDPSIVSTISDEQFIQFLSDHKGSIIVLEDCEKLLKSRDDGGHATIGTILNLTDGIVGDAFGVKFLCTFNSKLKDVDKALLRKGRLSLKYEFKKLPLEKVKKIYPGAEDDMTLAEAYYGMEENDFSKEERRQIGF